MENEDETSLVEQHNLSERELKAYKYFCDSRQAPLAPTVQAKFFELYLNGCSCEEIRRLNPDFGLGPIVQAKIVGSWDRRKQEHSDALLDGVRERVQTVSLESINFLANLLAATHKKDGDKLKRYLQTGNPEDLGDLSIGSLRQYREVLDTLMNITGTGGKTKIEGEIVHRHVADPAPAARPIDSEKASRILEALVTKKE